MIIGQPGSGKSWLARNMGLITGLPVIHIDQIHWQSGWVERPWPEREAMARQAAEADTWIIEGGMVATWPDRLARADTLIHLDPPFVLRVWRVLWRTLRDYGRTRPDLPPDCPERFDAEFWSYIWRTRRSARPRYLAARANAGPAHTVHHFRSGRAVRTYLRTLKRGT